MNKFRLTISLYGLLLFILLVSIWKFKPVEDRKVVTLFTMYDKNQAIILSQFLKDFKKEVEETTNLDIEIVSINDLENSKIKNDPFLALKNLDNGKIQLLHGVAYYWKKEIPEATFFASVPFGMYHETFQKWIEKGGGDTLWRKTYAIHGLSKVLPFMCGNTGPQWGGISSVEITKPSSFKNLKFRLPGLGEEVLSSANFGGLSQRVSPDAIPEFAAMPIDKFIDWIGPEEDIDLIIKNWRFPLNKPNKLFYYSNGWHEPSTQYEMLINSDFLKGLNPDVRDKIKIIIAKYDAIILSKYLEKNDLAYEQLRKNLSVNNIKIEIKSFNSDFINASKLELEKILTKYKSNSKEINCLMCDQVYSIYFKYKNENDTRNLTVIRNENK